jgi:hypothetical protein
MFSLWAIFMWSIHNLLTYEPLVGQVTKGYKGCPTCGPNSCGFHSKQLGKIVYVGHCRWLWLNHLNWSNKVLDFNLGSLKGRQPYHL